MKKVLMMICMIYMVSASGADERKELAKTFEDNATILNENTVNAAQDYFEGDNDAKEEALIQVDRGISAALAPLREMNGGNLQGLAKQKKTVLNTMYDTAMESIGDENPEHQLAYTEMLTHSKIASIDTVNKWKMNANDLRVKIKKTNLEHNQFVNRVKMRHYSDLLLTAPTIELLDEVNLFMHSVMDGGDTSDELVDFYNMHSRFSRAFSRLGIGDEQLSPVDRYNVLSSKRAMNDTERVIIDTHMVAALNDMGIWWRLVKMIDYTLLGTLVLIILCLRYVKIDIRL